MDAFLPSEIGRLIYGYLFQQCGEGLADEFLNTCDSMRECRHLKQKYAKNFHHKVQDLSLEDILNQYSVLCSLIFKQASTDEPVHRNVLGLLKKVLSSKLLGLSHLSADRSHVPKATANKVVSSNETEAIKTVTPVAHSEQSISNKVDSSVDNDARAAVSCASVAKLKQPTLPTYEKNVTSSSPNISDAEDHYMDINDDESGSRNVLTEDPLSNVAKVSIPVVAAAEYPRKNISPNAESRICAILSNSASFEERVRQPVGAGDLPFPSGYCTPSKQKSMSAPIVPPHPAPKLTKIPTLAASMVVDTSKMNMKSIDNSSNDLTLIADSGLTVPECGKHSKKKLGHRAAKTEKVLLKGSSKTPSKSVTNSSLIIATSSSTSESVSPVISTLTAKVNDSVLSTVPSVSSAEVPPFSVPVNLTNVPMLAVSSEHQERVSEISSPSKKKDEILTRVSACAIVSEETTESVFGELSFESECSLTGKLDKSNSSVKSNCEIGSQVHQSPVRRSPRKANGSPFGSVVSSCSGVSIAPTQNSTARKSDITSQMVKQSAADIAISPDFDETALTSLQNKDIPWDLKLRTFVDDNSSMDAHITKRKPKDVRSKKPKEVPKKRKHNDGLDESLSTAKRFKSEIIAAVPIVAATPCQSQLISKSVDANRSADLASSPPKTSFASGKEEVELAEKKSDKSKRGKKAQEKKITLEAANPKKSSTLMNDIINFDSSLREKEKTNHLEKTAAMEKKKQQVANIRKTGSKEIRDVTKAQSSANKLVADRKATISSEIARGRKRSEQIELVATQKHLKHSVDPKSFKESNLPPVKEKLLSSPRKMKNSRTKNTPSKASDEVNEKANEVLEYDYQSAIVTVQETAIDNSILNDEVPDFEMVLEISPEFELFHRSPRNYES